MRKSKKPKGSVAKFVSRSGMLRKRKVRKDKGPMPPLRALKVLCEKEPVVMEQIIAWSKDGEHSSAEVRALIKKDWKIELGTDSSLTNLYAWWRLRSRFNAASDRVSEMEAILLEKAPDLAPGRIREIGQELFTIEAVERGDSKDFVSLESLRLAQDSAKTKFALERQKLDLADRRVKVAERKLDQLRGALTEGALSDEQRVTRMKQVFGMS